MYINPVTIFTPAFNKTNFEGLKFPAGVDATDEDDEALDRVLSQIDPHCAEAVRERYLRWLKMPTYSEVARTLTNQNVYPYHQTKQELLETGSKAKRSLVAALFSQLSQDKEAELKSEHDAQFNVVKAVNRVGARYAVERGITQLCEPEIRQQLLGLVEKYPPLHAKLKEDARFHQGSMMDRALSKAEREQAGID